MSAMFESFSTKRALGEGISVSIGAIVGYFLAKYLLTSGLIRALLGFIIVFSVAFILSPLRLS